MLNYRLFHWRPACGIVAGQKLCNRETNLRGPPRFVFQSHNHEPRTKYTEKTTSSMVYRSHLTGIPTTCITQIMRCLEQSKVLGLRRTVNSVGWILEIRRPKSRVRRNHHQSTFDGCDQLSTKCTKIDRYHIDSIIHTRSGHNCKLRGSRCSGCDPHNRRE